MAIQWTGDYYCPICGSAYCHGHYPPVLCGVYGYYNRVFGETIPQGWQCPICKKVYAPSVTECNNIKGHEEK